MTVPKILYTFTDEAPALATHSLLPIIQAFAGTASITVETRDISLAGRILANFPEELTPQQRQADDLHELGELATTPDANIVKLPNISASLPQLKAAISELQSQGYRVPEYPEEPRNDAQKKVKARYAKVLGSAVNPVLREGNSDRRVANAVKQYAQKHPHSMGPWTRDSRTHVAHMSGADFYANEQSALIESAGALRIELRERGGATVVLKEAVRVLQGELISSTFMRCAALREFYETQMQEAKAKDLLLSLHLKATMMKVSDPIMFGHAVSVYYRDVFEASAMPTRKSSHSPRRSGNRSRRTCRRRTHSGRRLRWSTPARASPICTSRATSSSMPRCPLPSGLRAACTARTASCATRRL
jgi:isocitrate dehydrogenase